MLTKLDTHVMIDIQIKQIRFSPNILHFFLGPLSLFQIIHNRHDVTTDQNQNSIDPERHEHDIRRATAVIDCEPSDRNENDRNTTVPPKLDSADLSDLTSEVLIHFYYIIQDISAE
jgi:hypothetical protein